MAEISEEILLQAIHSEILARNAYEMLAGRIEAQDGRLVMTTMSREEEGHRSTLAARYLKLTGKDYEFDASIESGPDFSFVKASTFKYTDALEALKLALSAEIDAIEFYSTAIKETNGMADKSMFKTLLRFEKKHQKILMKEIAKMQKSNHWKVPKE
jgi:rubrerythrin